MTPFSGAAPPVLPCAPPLRSVCFPYQSEWNLNL